MQYKFRQIIFIFFLVLFMGCNNAYKKQLFIEEKLPIEIEVAFTEKFSGGFIDFIHLIYYVHDRYPCIRIHYFDDTCTNPTTKHYRLVKFWGKEWQVVHKIGNDYLALLDHAIECAGSEFYILKVNRKGRITEIGKINKNSFEEIYVKSFIKNGILSVVTEDEGKMITYKFKLSPLLIIPEDEYLKE